MGERERSLRAGATCARIALHHVVVARQQQKNRKKNRECIVRNLLSLSLSLNPSSSPISRGKGLRPDWGLEE
jgi:phosphopantetheinyl transferase